jgi:hypothetical protein
MSLVIQLKAGIKAMLINLPKSKMSENPKNKDRIKQVNGKIHLTVNIRIYFLYIERNLTTIVMMSDMFC